MLSLAIWIGLLLAATSCAFLPRPALPCLAAIGRSARF